MNDNNNEAQAALLRLKDLLYEAQLHESNNALVIAHNCDGFLSLPRCQQVDILSSLSGEALNLRCKIAEEVALAAKLLDAFSTSS